MALLLNKFKFPQLMKVPVRYKAKEHWAKLRKKKTPTDKALEHFDDFYASVYQDSWPNIRAALLKEECKYMAIVNNFSDTERIQSDLELLGTINLENLYNTQKDNVRFLNAVKKSEMSKLQKENNSIDATNTSKDQLDELEKIYSTNSLNVLEGLRAEDTETVKEDRSVPVKLQSIEDDLNEINLDTNRIINSSVNLSSLHEYIPATKIKGLDDWVLESDHYKFYGKAADHQTNIEKESVLSFPKHLHAYTYERGNNTRFPNPKKGSTGVLDYYLFDGGSILPVLALDIQLGDTVLDMCAAPGGKALTILQTLLPRTLVANDIQRSRVNRIKGVMNQYVSDVYKTEKMMFITEQDARAIDETNIYNKILVDVPCTTDRHILHSDDNNIFKPSRLKERLRMPELQSEILTNALKLVSVGGTVVYSTCSLSPIQNDGVVQVALQKAYQESDCDLVVKDMTEALVPLQYIYQFGNIGSKYGHIVIPSIKNNWGPMYFCKIVKIQ
ncbi:Putative methyltransferase NSUN4 [Habropoda laboriosa]|uniref:NOL1/NOP2/Sun domain family member 4 n=1 Tax=Habropoda laboriosa TaxID=597456 RepID=A0A0L7QLS4_9HYME|nr:PREDICTED: 5-methylcytosine rRNA methyltransferase NSUN4 [Habropoda laboriosa]KOC59598.1 Putative methyltransferase NSUN4 [Habropoda laboriosa]